MKPQFVAVQPTGETLRGPGGVMVHRTSTILVNPDAHLSIQCTFTCTHCTVFSSKQLPKTCCVSTNCV